MSWGSSHERVHVLERVPHLDDRPRPEVQWETDAVRTCDRASSVDRATPHPALAIGEKPGTHDVLTAIAIALQVTP